MAFTDRLLQQDEHLIGFCYQSGAHLVVDRLGFA